MNKKEILRKFKDSTKIKKTILNYKTNEEIFKEFKKTCINMFTNTNGKSVTEEEFNENYKENQDTYRFGTLYIYKNNLKKEEIIDKLSYDINTTKIKEYDKNKGEWFKTDFALYSLI